MKALLDSIKSLGLPRLVAMGSVAVVALAMLGFLALRAGNQPMALLYGDLGLRDAASVADALKGAHIPYSLGAQGSEILVPANQVAPARLLLAKVGLPTGGSIGFRIFDHANLLGQTAFQQRIDETRALEGELEQTIRLIQGVRGAKVNLVLPRRQPFSQTSQPARASVLLTMAGAMPLDPQGVAAIINLVAAAVPGLRPQDIAIVDNRGDLLARAGAPVGVLGGSSSAEEIRRGIELRLTRAVEDMLARAFGPGHVRVETSVAMNFDQQRQTQTSFDPNGQVLRSQQTSSTKSSRTRAANRNVSVQNNLPNANAGQGQAGSQRTTTHEIDNYEISKTVRTLIHDQPQIKRISVAVMVDGTEAKGPGGKPVWQPRTPAQLTQIADLVKSAIGYDKARGDHVFVTSMRFVRPASGAPAKRPTLFGVPLPGPAAMPLVETAIFGLVALFALLFVFRPMVLRLGLPQLGGGEAGSEPPAIAGGAGGPPVAGAAGTSLLAGPAGGAGGGDESMVEVGQIEGQMRASSLRRVAGLADAHPDETLAILRGWMTQEAG